MGRCPSNEHVLHLHSPIRLALIFKRSSSFFEFSTRSLMLGYTPHIVQIISSRRSLEPESSHHVYSFNLCQNRIGPIFGVSATLIKESSRVGNWNAFINLVGVHDSRSFSFVVGHFKCRPFSSLDSLTSPLESACYGRHLFPLSCPPLHC